MLTTITTLEQLKEIAIQEATIRLTEDTTKAIQATTA